MGVLVAHDIRAYYKVMQALRRLEERASPRLRELVHSALRVTLGQGDGIRVRGDEDPREVYFKVALAALGVSRFRTLSIGVDPGKRIGVAVFGDDVLLDAEVLHSLDELLAYVGSALRQPASRRIIKVGNGESGLRVYAELLRIYGRLASIVLVDEGRRERAMWLSHLGLPRRERDLIAAARIALAPVNP